MSERVYAVGDLCKWCDAKGWQCLAICQGCGEKSCHNHHRHVDRGLRRVTLCCECVTGPAATEEP